MNELHVESKLFNQKDVLNVLENLADAQDVVALREAVEELKNGTLPLYLITSEDVLDDFMDGKSAPFFLQEDGGVLYLVVSTFLSNREITCYAIGVDEPNIEYMEISWGEDQKWEEASVDTSFYFATKGYVDTAVAGAGGTKLFSHTFNVNCTWTYDNVSRTGNVTFNVICTTENKFVNLTDTRFLAIKEYIMRGISNYSVLAVNLSGSLELTSFTDMPVGILNNFIAKSMIYISLPYPGATLSFGAYLADKIDLTTGVRANRTNVLSNVAVNSIGEDTVTPL